MSNGFKDLRREEYPKNKEKVVRAKAPQYLKVLRIMLRKSNKKKLSIHFSVKEKMTVMRKKPVQKVCIKLLSNQNTHLNLKI